MGILSLMFFHYKVILARFEKTSAIQDGTVYDKGGRRAIDTRSLPVMVLIAAWQIRC